MVVKRNSLLLIFWLTSLISCEQNIKVLKGRGYEINGQVANCEGCEVILQLYDYNQFKMAEQTPIQVDTVRDGRFAISGRINRNGFYEVHIKDAQTRRSASTKIYLPAYSVKITADLNGLPTANLPRFTSMPNAQPSSGSFDQITVNSSSPVQDEITQYFLLQDSMTLEHKKKEKQIWAAFRSTYDSENRELINAWADSVRLIPSKYPFYKAIAADLFIRKHPQSEVAILAMLESHHEKTTNFRFNQYFKALTPATQKSFYGQILAQKLAKSNKPAKYKQHWVGSSITYLKGKTPAGEELDVQHIFKENKFTLVNFWASWHTVSRGQLADFQKIYQQNRNKGFEIIAVSFDYNYNSWTETISEEKLTFLQVSELKGDLAQEYKRFRIKDIPFNILFDQNGTMVAVDLTPQELAQKLNQVQ